MSPKRGYLYGVYRGRFIILEGKIKPTRYAEHCWFIPDLNNATIYCSTNPELVYNGCLLFDERDDEKAKKILIAHEESIILKIQKEIEFHQSTINILMNT